MAAIVLIKEATCFSRYHNSMAYRLCFASSWIVFYIIWVGSM